MEAGIPPASKQRRAPARTRASGRPDEDVHRGRDGWLFLVGGSNRALDFFTRPNAFPEEAVQAWMRLLQARQDRAAALGAEYLHLVVPEKLSVYHDRYDGRLPYRARSPAMRLPAAAEAAGIGRAMLDVLPYMLRQKELYQLYWRTDTHWTFEGCLSAFQLLCARLGCEIGPAIARARMDSTELALDLGARLDPPVRELFTSASFLASARRVAVNPLVAFKERQGRENDGGLHVGSNVVYCNARPDAVARTVVLFGDSFAEYRPHLLTGMLAETFREVHFIWSAGIDWHYVERVRPDILLTEGAERFALQVPDDDFDLDALVVRRLAPLIGAAPA